jgi:hypothetical protein
MGFVTLIVIGSFATAVQAQSPLADLRERVNGMMVMLRSFDNTCVIILGALLKEADAAILEARKLITVGKGNLSHLLRNAFISAGDQIDRADHTLIHCDSLLGVNDVGDPDDETAGTLYGEANTIQAELNALTGLDPRKATKIGELLNNLVFAELDHIQGFLGITTTAFESLAIPALNAPIARPQFHDIDPKVHAILDALVAFLNYLDCLSAGTAPNVCLDALVQALGEIFGGDEEFTGLSPAIAAPQLTEKGAIPFAGLRVLKEELGRLHTLVTDALRIVKGITKAKKWLYKALREIYNLLRSSNFGGRGASELPSGVIRVYTLDGKLVETQTNGLNTTRLANGLYLAVSEKRDVQGRSILHVRKVAVAR